MISHVIDEEAELGQVITLSNLTWLKVMEYLVRYGTPNYSEVFVDG